MGKLTVRQVETFKEPGRYADGSNLYLNIAKGGSKSWVLFYRFGTQQREMGLGGASKVSLADARKKAMAALKLLQDGVDPLTARRESDRIESGRISFGEFADAYIITHEGKFRNDKHKTQWRVTLGPSYLGQLRSMAVADIDTQAVLKVLQPLWQRVPETASRIRGRIENVLNAAKAQGIFHGDNPAQWKGHLEAILPKRQRLTRGHHAALPYDDLPAFMQRLQAVKNSIGAIALEFTILCAARTGETIGAVWSEIDLDKGMWIVPRERMKAGVEHRVPLSERAIEILQSMQALRVAQNPFVFAGTKQGKGLSNMTMAKVLKGMGLVDVTVHGFRSTFRDWASEQTSFPHEVCEMALAHTIGNKAEAAYRRGDLFDKRRKLMEAWTDFCAPQITSKTVQIHTKIMQ